MKTPEEIIKQKTIPGWGSLKHEEVIEVMKEFGRQAWIACDLNWNSNRADVFAFEIEEAQKSNERYEHWLQSLHLNQIAKESQERGEYQNPVKDWDDDFKNEFGEFLKDE